MHNEFTVNEIITEIRNKTISINFAYDIDPNSINETTIQIKKRGSTECIEYNANVEGRTVNVVLLNWPQPNEEYILRIEKLKNIIGDVLATSVRRKITFESSICSTVNIISPSFNELISELSIKWKEVLADETHQYVNSYLLEIATDTNFYNLVNSSYIQDKQNITLESLPAGQYFLRMRVQKDNQYGFWSEKYTFIMKEKEEATNSSNNLIEDNNNDPVFIQPIHLLSYPENGETPSSFLFEFDCPINSDFLDDIIIIRKEI